MLQFGLLLPAVFYETFDLADLGGDLHHAQVADLLGSLDCAELEVLAQPDYH